MALKGHGNIAHRLSGNICGKCGGEAPGWKCPKCGRTEPTFNSFHWKDCPQHARLQAQCKRCGQAEDNCTCASAFG